MGAPDIQDIVHVWLFPYPKPKEPHNFSDFLERHLIPEVRGEVNRFFGPITNNEARYPGLDYTYEPHRRRLSLWPWHRRLFRVFKELHLTDQEIGTLCAWEGTKSAKDRFEINIGRSIEDTTHCGIPTIVSDGPCAIWNMHQEVLNSTGESGKAGNGKTRADDGQKGGGGDELDEVDASVGLELNEQLIAVAEGELTTAGPLEEWLKYMTERDRNPDAMLRAIREGYGPPTASERDLMTPQPAPEDDSQSEMASSTRQGTPATSITTPSPQQASAYHRNQEELLARS